MTSTNGINQTLNVTERVVAELWSEVLQTDALPNADDDFFSLGGDSMSMVALEFRIREEFSVELPPGVILRAPTLRDLSALVAAAHTDSTAPNV